jgi:predicted metal-dependent enzyme (double-stranded beta helix superfamily)
MAGKDWLVTKEGECEPLQSIGHHQITNKYYRLYHFLNDLENILENSENERVALQKICPLVRRLLMSSHWLQTTIRKPDPNTGWSLLKLYDEPFFPFTVQTAVWTPGPISPIHNHATWGVVAIIGGLEKNTFWKKSKNIVIKNGVERIGARILEAGDVVAFETGAIHCIETVSPQPTITFNLYGQTQGEVIYFNPVS